MNGLINRTVQSFVVDTYGPKCWVEVTVRARLEFTDFEAMLTYEPRLLEDVLAAAESILHKGRDEILEDLGTYLVSHPNNEVLRRLMRFSGVDFLELLHSLDDLPDRAHLAVADLDLPELELREISPGNYFLEVRGGLQGFGHVMVGVLRAMADDYGSLVLLDHRGRVGQTEKIDVALVETKFARGREFRLSAETTHGAGPAA